MHGLRKADALTLKVNSLFMIKGVLRRRNKLSRFAIAEFEPGLSPPSWLDQLAVCRNTNRQK
jgi:hypothetical protein